MRQRPDLASRRPATVPISSIEAAPPVGTARAGTGPIDREPQGSDPAVAARGAPRRYSLLDRLITPVDQALRTVLGASHASRPYPADGIPDTLESKAERSHAAALMRVNHSGEIAAQALYNGQAFTAQSYSTRASLETAAREETDHLAWCAQRVHELDGRVSALGPVWYAGSFVIGALAGLGGDRTSLGFVAETERQVVEHLEGHLHKLPAHDARSRAIVRTMSDDEARHGRHAQLAGGADLPPPARAFMKLTARIMTTTAYYL